MGQKRHDMDEGGGFRERVSKAVGRFKDARILVVGDIMLDQFVWGEVCRISPEAPVPVVEVERETMLLGGAANVANNLRALGASCGLAGLIGADGHGETVLKLAKEQGIDTSCLITDDRPTTLKTRIVARGQQVVRVDRESRTGLDAGQAGLLCSRIEEALSATDAVIVSDYQKGVVTAPVMEGLRDECSRRGIPLLVDPKPENKTLYRGASLITPNNREAELMSGMRIESDSQVEEAARIIGSELDASGVLVTRGPKGMTLWQRDKGVYSIPTAAREVFDVTGAGDTVISVAALGLVAGLAMCEAAWLANLAAGIVVAKVGTATVAADEIMQALEERGDMLPENLSTRER